MKILHVGNMANIGYMISRQLRLQGIEAELLMEKNPKSVENPLNPDSSLNNSYPDWFSFYDKKSSWKTTIIKKMRDRNYNLIHAYVELPIFAYLSRKPFVAHPQGSDLREMAFSNSIRGILLRRAYRKAKAIIVSSPEQIFLVKKLKLQNGILIPFTPEYPFFNNFHALKRPPIPPPITTTVLPESFFNFFCTFMSLFILTKYYLRKFVEQFSYQILGLNSFSCFNNIGHTSKNSIDESLHFAVNTYKNVIRNKFYTLAMIWEHVQV